jgi:hypothetical protein
MSEAEKEAPWLRARGLAYNRDLPRGMVAGSRPGVTLVYMCG